MLTTPDLGAYLAAVGNHEAKALTYVAMEPHEAYGVGALHRLFLDIQGEDPVFTGVVNLQQKYCRYSFEPAGLVRREAIDKGRMRHVKNDPGGLGTALAGHLLAATESHEASLTQIFGRTGAPGSDGPDAERPPIRRYALLRAMAGGPRTATAAHAARSTGVRDLTVGHIATALARAGLVDYRTEPTYQMKSSYRVDSPIPATTGRSSRPLINAVVHYINERHASQDRGPLVISRDEIETHLREQPQWADRAALRDTLQKTMIRLAEGGRLAPLRDFTGQSQHSIISVTVPQREFIQHLIAGIELIAAGDRPAVNHGEDQAEQIIQNPLRVRSLLTKAFGTSKLVVNPISEGDKQRRVLAVLSPDLGLTTEEIAARLSPDLNTPLARSTLGHLANEGRVLGEKQPDGPYKRWYLT